MTNEEKGLLLKDLCGRLPYGVMCEYTFMDGRKTDMVFKGQHFDHEVICKPYLRPMESMTEEEINEFILISDTILWIGNKRSTCILSLGQMDWLNKKGFDYRGLIPMRLALPATEGMYETK